MAASLLLHSCAGAGGGAYNESPARLSETAPTAREMEAPLRTADAENLPSFQSNGNGGSSGAATNVRRNPPPVPPATQSNDPRIDEVLTMPTSDLHGYAFPGVEQLPDPFPREDRAAERQVAQEMAVRLAATEKRLRELETEVQRVPAALEAELQALETQVAAIDQRDPQPVAVTPSEMEDQLEAMRARLAALEAAPTTPAIPDIAPALQARIDALEAELETFRNAPRELSDDANQRLAALEAEVSRLEQQTPPAASVDADALSGQLTALRARLDTLETRPAAPDTAAGLQERIDALEAEVRGYAQMTPALGDEANQRLAKLEAEIARIEQAQQPTEALEDELARIALRVPSAMDVDEIVSQVSALRARVEAIEPASNTVVAQPEIDPGLYTRIAALESELNQPNEPSAEVAQRIAALENVVAHLESRNASAASSLSGDKFTADRFDALESKIARLEAQTQAALLASPPQGVDGHVAGPFGSYNIGAGDILEFQSFNDDTLSRELTVRYDGNISLPLIADIQVAGLSREDAESAVRTAYTTIFRDPQISLLVRETTSKTFTIMGDIESPGIYPYTGDTSLIEAISAAGGLRRRNSSSSVGGFVGITGQLTKAFIVRTNNGTREILPYDLRGIGEPGAHSSDSPVYFGDLIYVPEGVNLVYVLGESSNPVIVELTEGMTLLQLLSLSGGFNATTARLRNVALFRDMGDNQTQVMNMNVRKMLRTGTDFPLQPGDILYIPQKLLVRLSEFVGRFTSSVSPVLSMYNSAVQAYYAQDIARTSLREPRQLRTLERLTELEQFGTSTQNLVDLYGAP